MKLTKSQISIDSLLEALSRGRDAIKEASEIMVALVDQNPRIYEQILKQAPSLSLNLLVTLEKVGRGVIYDALLFDSSPGARRLLTLPYSQQKEYYENPVKVVKVENGKKVELEKPIQQLTPKECSVVFSENGVRDTKEQVRVLNMMAHSKSSPAQRYEINKSNGNLIVFLPNTEFTPAQLEEIYQRSKEIAIKSLGRGLVGH